MVSVGDLYDRLPLWPVLVLGAVGLLLGIVLVITDPNRRQR